MKHFLIILIFCFSYVFAKDLDLSPKKHPILSKMFELQPKLELKTAMQISNAIHRCAKQIGIDKFLLTAIYNQESSFKVDAVNSRRGYLDENSVMLIVQELIQHNLVSDLTDENIKNIKNAINQKVVQVNSDFGISQINYKNMLRLEYCSDKTKILNDYKYSIQCSCNILKSLKRRYEKNEKLWWTRYHSNNSYLRSQYYNAVSRFLERSDDLESGRVDTESVESR